MIGRATTTLQLYNTVNSPCTHIHQPRQYDCYISWSGREIFAILTFVTSAKSRWSKRQGHFGSNPTIHMTIFKVQESLFPIPTKTCLTVTKYWQYFRRFRHSCRRQCDVPGLSNSPQPRTVSGPWEFRPGPFPARYHNKEEPVQLFSILCWAEELCGYVGSTKHPISSGHRTKHYTFWMKWRSFLIIQGVQTMIV